MLIASSRPTFQGDGCLHMVPPRRGAPRLPRLAVGTLNIWDGRLHELVQAIQAVQHSGLDIISLIYITLKEA